MSNFQDFIKDKMNEFEINIKHKMGYENPIFKDFKDDVYKKSQKDRIGFEYHDTRNNDIERVEKIHDITLDSFSRSSYESSYNNYLKTSEGSPTALRKMIKGYVYRNRIGEIACKLVVEKNNNITVITDLYVNPRYYGHGLTKALIDVAKTNLGANAALCDRDNLLLMNAYKKNNFFIKDKVKNGYLMICEELYKRPGTPVNQIKASNNITAYKNNITNSDGSTTSGKKMSLMNLDNMSTKTSNMNKRDVHDMEPDYEKHDGIDDREDEDNSDILDDYFIDGSTDRHSSIYR